jgi:predicted glycosyltransferase
MVSQNYDDHTVYNLSYNTDVPSKRQRTIDEIMELNPKIVFYGISDLEFRSVISTERLALNAEHADIQNILLNTIGSEFSNPQFISLQAIREIGQKIDMGKKESRLFQPYTPFFEYHNEQFTIKNNNDIEIQFLKSKEEFVISSPSENKELSILKDMINKLQKRGIKVVLFTTPYHRVYLDSLNNEQKSSFDSILNELQKSNMTIYRLDDKYADMPIWYNFDHISYTKNSIIYSEDIARLIISEIDK